jgi:hypothetical protein
VVSSCKANSIQTRYEAMRAATRALTTSLSAETDFRHPRSCFATLFLTSLIGTV